MKKHLSLIADVAMYLFVYLLLQTFGYILMRYAMPGNEAMSLVLSQAISAVASIVIFVAAKWANVGRIQHTTNKVALLAAIALLAVAQLPLTIWSIELSEVDIPEILENMLMKILSEPLGFLCISIIVPVAEEVVFRGAILRRLLVSLPHSDEAPYRPWIAIAVSALIFALAHGNMAQGPHAFAMGALIGWLYYRTGSILPGIVFHWINNTAAVVLGEYFGNETTLIEMCGGSTVVMYSVLAVSALLAIGSVALIAKKLF